MELTNFLKKENMMLKQENKQLKNLLQLNRHALKLSTCQKKEQSNYSALLNLLFQQNSKLHTKIRELSTELQTGMCKALISEQIAFASTEQERYLTFQLKDKLKKMRKDLENRQKKIVELSKVDMEKRPFLGEGKIIEYVDMNIVSKKMKDEINQLRNEIEEKQQQVFKYKDQKEELLKLNLILTKQINQLKLISSQQSTGSNDLNSGDLSKFLSYQRKIIQDQDDNESDEQYVDDSGDSESDISSEEPPVEEPSKIMSKVSKLQISKIPKLELTKAKEIQDLIVQKINNDENKKKGVVKQQKMKKVELEVSNLRKKIGTIILEKIEIEKQNSFLKKFVKQLECRNQTLLNCKKDENNKTSNSYYNLQINHKPTQTLLDICRDVTLNQVLKKAINGTIILPYNSKIVSEQI